MKKVVLDTNIWFSTTIGGEIGKQIPKILGKSDIKIFTCQEILDEFDDITSRTKSQKYLMPDRINETKKLMFYFTDFVALLSPVITISRDPKDDYLLILSSDYDFDYLVTGDKDLLVLGQYQNTRILTFSNFIKELEALKII